ERDALPTELRPHPVYLQHVARKVTATKLFPPNLPPNLYVGSVNRQHYKLGAYRRVADHLYRYSANKKYYAVFKFNGKTKWIQLATTDRELAGRKVKEE